MSTEPLTTEQRLMRAHRKKQAEARAEAVRAKQPKTPAPSRFCDEREGDTMRVCTLPPGHEGDHDSGVKTWPRRDSEEPSLTDICPKCNREFGEHDGKKCPKPVSEDRLAHVYSLIVGAGASGARATDIALVHRSAIRDLERAGRIEYRNDRWFPAEEPQPDTKNTGSPPGRATEETTRSMEAIDHIRLDRIAPDAAQPRKHFDETKLNELAASITKHGVQQPICVRPVAGKAGHYTIVFGERRWRASEIAGLDTIPAIVDTEANDDPNALLERQLIENAQREDLHPLEEGEALRTLHEQHIYGIEELAAKVGKSRSHVYARIALTKLAPGVQKAMLEGRLPHAHGELIGRIPDHKLQEQCCKEVLGQVNHDVLRNLEDVGLRHEAVNEKDERAVWQGDSKKQTLSFRATAQLVRRRYQTRLSLATFDPADAALTPAGPCGPCPHNSGNQPELPGMSAPAKADSYCGNLPCFEQKTAAQWKRTADAARAEGKKVFEGKKAEAMFYGAGQLKSDSGYAVPTQRLPYSVIQSYDNKLTYKKLLGKHIAEVPKAIVQDERGAAVEVLDQKKAIEILRERKLLPKKGSSSGIRNGSQTEAEKKAAKLRKEEREKEKLREEAFPFLLTQAVGAAKTLPEAKAAALWRLVALFLREYLDYAAGELYRSLYDDAEPHDHIGERIEKLKSESDLRGLVIELLLIQAADDVTSGAGVTEAMELATKLLGLDWKKAEKYALDKRALDKQTEAAEKATTAKKKGARK